MEPVCICSPISITCQFIGSLISKRCQRFHYVLTLVYKWRISLPLCFGEILYIWSQRIKNNATKRNDGVNEADVLFGGFFDILKGVL